MRFFLFPLALLMLAGIASAATCDLDASQQNGMVLDYTILGLPYKIATQVTPTEATFTVNGQQGPPLEAGESATLGALTITATRIVSSDGINGRVTFCALASKVACTDTDGGAIPATQGTTHNARGAKGTDTCAGPDLVEYSCSANGEVLSSQVTCQHGCIAGACATQSACHPRLHGIPASCTGGTITQDTSSGACRTVVCSGAGKSLQLLACEKPDAGAPQYFEMYRQSSTGSGVKVCIGGTCMQDEGFVRSGSFPLCPAVCTPSTEICDGKDNDCDAQVDEGDVCALKGNVDVFTNGSVQGWTYDPASSSSPIDVRISVDGATRAQFPTNLTRGDVNAAFNITGAHGFSYPWSGICGTHDVTVSAISGAKTLTLRTGQLSFGTCGPAQVNGAQFVGQSVPSTMVPGQQYNVSVTMKNTGTTTWTKAAGYKLGSQHPADNTVWGTGRVLLSDAESIAPGATKTFAFQVTAPSTTGTHHFQWRMVKEGAEWFGDLTPDTSIEVQGTSACTTRLHDMPVSCEGGTITQDTKAGCRTIVCSGQGQDGRTDSLKVLACDKPDTGNPQYFEMYKQSSSGAVPKICLGATCIQGNGFARSPSYPICPSATADVRVLPGFPQHHNVAFACNVTGMNATSYSWDFGDGTSNPGSAISPHLNRPVNDVYHTFLGNGTYLVTCNATDGQRTATGTLQVQVSTPRAPVQGPNGTFPAGIFSTDLLIAHEGDMNYKFQCPGIGYPADATRWLARYAGTTSSIIDAGPYGERGDSLSYDFPDYGDLNISCDSRVAPKYLPAYYDYRDALAYHNQGGILCRGPSGCTAAGDSGSFSVEGPSCGQVHQFRVLSWPSGDSSHSVTQRVGGFATELTPQPVWAQVTAQFNESSDRNARWLWSFPTNATTGETFTFYHLFLMPEGTAIGTLKITVDNSYQAYLNGQLIGSDSEWQTVENWNVTPYLREGVNNLTVVATNGPSTGGANPGGIIYSLSTRIEGLCGGSPMCGNGAIETGEQCDDGNTASGDGCSSTCQMEDPSGRSATLSVAQWYPQGRNYVFICKANGFTATSYDWSFGDGQAQYGSSNADVYHSYASAGSYAVSCTAKAGAQSAIGTLQVTVA